MNSSLYQTFSGQPNVPQPSRTRKVIRGTKEKRKEEQSYLMIPEKQGVGVQPEEGIVINIRDMALFNNEFFRRIIYTSSNNSGNGMQLAVMNLLPGEEIGTEVHTNGDQQIRVEEGIGRAKIGNDIYEIKENALIIVPKGIAHNVINISDTVSLKLSIIYSFAAHPPGFLQPTFQS